MHENIISKKLEPILNQTLAQRTHDSKNHIFALKLMTLYKQQQLKYIVICNSTAICHNGLCCLI